MSEELKIIQNEDGTFEEYDDTYDITIHCQSEEEQNEVLAKLNAPQPCGDCISREKALQIIRAWFDREATPSDLKNEIEQLPPVTPQPMSGYISIDDAMSAFDDFMCNDIEPEGQEVFLELLKDRAERSKELHLKIKPK